MNIHDSLESHEANQEGVNEHSQEFGQRIGKIALDLKGYDNSLDGRSEEGYEIKEDVSHAEASKKKDKYPEYFSDWQIECLETIKNKKNVILSSPTGSGKTSVFMEWAKLKRQEAEENGKLHHTTYITAPIKALSNQRYRELKEQGYNVGIETGDIKYVPEDADYVCCTQEIYTNKHSDDKNSTLIVDEFHYIFENKERQRAYIDGIYNAKSDNVLLCSATLGNTEKLENYIDKVTKTSYYTYENHERLTKLEYGGYIEKEDIKNALVVSFSAKNCEKIASDIAEYREKLDETTEKKIEDICQKHKVDSSALLSRKGVATYYGAMLPKEKLCVEELFENRLIDTVVGTDALALGVNFPVDKVVFTQLAKYGSGVISKNLFDQLAGRAGRKGYFDEGTVYYNDNFTNDRGYPVEARKYVDHGYYEDEPDTPLTKELYNELIEKKNEDISISLEPKMSDILSGRTTMAEEVSYINAYSTTYNYDYTEDEVADAIEKIEQHDVFEDYNFSELEELYIVYGATRQMGIMAFVDKEKIGTSDYSKVTITNPTSQKVEEYTVYSSFHNDNRIGLVKDADKIENWHEYYPEQLDYDSESAKRVITILKDKQRYEAMAESGIWLEHEDYETNDGKPIYDGHYEYECDSFGSDYDTLNDGSVSFLYRDDSEWDYDAEENRKVTRGIMGFFNIEEEYGRFQRSIKESYDVIQKDNRWYLDDYEAKDKTPAERMQIEQKINVAWDMIQKEKAEQESRRETLINEYKSNHPDAQELYQTMVHECYNDNLSVERNCTIFSALARGEDPIRDYFDGVVEVKLGDLLSLRSCLMNIPRKYRKDIDFASLDEAINEIDDTVLNSGRGLINIEEVA